MKRLILSIAISASALMADAQSVAPCGPVPSNNQIQWQDMEMYAFIHYSLNTYTDQEWGFGNESLQLFNPSDLDCRQWAKVCRQSGMKGIIFTAKHHCGFCMWPSKFTDYSVKNTPWKGGKGDVVRELAEACKAEGLKFAVYLSPWDRNHPEYGRPEYVTYFRNQLRELLTEYGDMFEVWFDGANGGDGWYGGANETRRIDGKTYYGWAETFKMIRELQPNCLIWNDGGDRGDIRWVGTEAGNIGETNWSLMYRTGDTPYQMLHFGVEDGDVWCPGETNTSIRPGWFYHDTENEHVKSLSKLMDTYYKSVGRNSTLLLNFPIAPNGRIHPNDSLRGIAFYKMIQEVFKNDLAANAKIKTVDNQTVITFKKPTAVNRFVAEEDIRYGQRVKKFSLEAYVDGKWIPLKDQLANNGDGLTTIGRRRIICFPTVNANALRFTVLDSKCKPIIKRTSAFLAPELTADIPNSGEKLSSNLHIFMPSPKQMFIDYDNEQTITSFRYLPPQDTRNGLVTHYTLWASKDWQHWEKISSGEFSNIVNNPIWQTVKFSPIRAKILRFEADRLAEGDRLGYGDIEVVTNNDLPYIEGGWQEFEINNPDTVIRLNRTEIATNNKSRLFYADGRQEVKISLSMMCHTLGTEQVFVCKEGVRGEVFADLAIGYDNTQHRIFAEVKDLDGNPCRVAAVNPAQKDVWYNVELVCTYNSVAKTSTMVLTVNNKDSNQKPQISRLEYKGYALPHRVGRWVVGRGFPGGFPNSLQVLDGEIARVRISAMGFERKKGENPIFGDRFTADPACTVVGDRIYAYVGEDRADVGGWFNMPHWVCYSSADMVNWTCHGVVLRASDFKYANPFGAWAGQVVERNGKFYYYVTLDDRSNGKHTIDVAVSDSPTGPFVPARKDGTPLITDDMTPDSHRPNADIDPTVLIDDDGTAWMAWGNGDCYMVKLKPNMTELDGEIRKVPLRNYSEGPWLFKRNGLYYNVYAADAPGVQPEQMAYSYARSIKGPWTYGGLLTGSAKYGFTIHPSVNEFGGKWYFFYHDGSYMLHNTPGGDCRRQVCVEHFRFRDDGTIEKIVLTQEGIGN